MNLHCTKCLKFTNNNNIKKNTKEMEKLIVILTVLSVVLKSLKLLIKKNYVIY